VVFVRKRKIFYDTITALLQKKKLADLQASFGMAQDGIEPPTHGFSVHCSTD
jgi:hypothetical protein